MWCSHAQFYNICVSIDETGSKGGMRTAEMLYECFSAPCHWASFTPPAKPGIASQFL